jgi:hypothetical protein
MATAYKSARAMPFIHPDDMPDLYAITGYGTCMVPLYHDGDLLVGDKREKPELGDVVFVHFTREAAPRYGFPGWIKRLIHIWPVEGEETLFTLEQINPRRRYIVPAGDITGIHKVVGTATSTGEGTADFRLPNDGATPRQPLRPVSRMAEIVTQACAQHAIPPTRFGRQAVGDPRLVSDLQNGRTLRPSTEAKVAAFIANLGEARP